MERRKNKRNTNERSGSYRTFTFGRRDADARPRLTLMPVASMEPREEAEIIVHAMPSSIEYFDGLLAQLQRDGYVLVMKDTVDKEAGVV